MCSAYLRSWRILPPETWRHSSGSASSRGSRILPFLAEPNGVRAGVQHLTPVGKHQLAIALDVEIQDGPDVPQNFVPSAILVRQTQEQGQHI